MELISIHKGEDTDLRDLQPNAMDGTQPRIRRMRLNGRHDRDADVASQRVTEYRNEIDERDAFFTVVEIQHFNVFFDVRSLFLLSSPSLSLLSLPSLSPFSLSLPSLPSLLSPFSPFSHSPSAGSDEGFEYN